VALFDPDHIHHEATHEWFAANRDAGWARRRDGRLATFDRGIPQASVAGATSGNLEIIPA
jgi:hypothetical protein